MIKRKRERHRCGWRADISDYSEYMILVPQLLHRLARSARLVTIVCRKQLQLTTINSTGLVRETEYGLNPELHLSAKFFGGAGERRNNPEADLLIRNTLRSAAGHIDPRGLCRCAGSLRSYNARGKISCRFIRFVDRGLNPRRRGRWRGSCDCRSKRI